MNKIQLLDCTLRDGGHLVGGNFGERNIKFVIKKLVESKVDIIELGFLMEEAYTADYARFKSIADVKRVLPEDKKGSKYSLMADFVDLHNLEPCDGTIDFIRLSFKRFRLNWALETAGILIDKGYNVFINPVNCNVYTDREYIELLEKVNELHPYGFCIVDTFGVMRLRDLSRLYYLVDANLNNDIRLGLHLHENLGLAYSLAQHFIAINEGKRNIVIDGSLLGMGRVPGNLNIEQIMDYLNEIYGTGYNLAPALDAIDDIIFPLKQQIPWGYSIPYFLSAKHKLHRTYAEFLINKWKIKTKDIEQILSQVDKNEAELFNERHVNKLYHDYLNIPYDDSGEKKKLTGLLENRKILIIAPGFSIKGREHFLNELAQKDNTIVFAVHFCPVFLRVDYCFFTNIKRYEQFDKKTDAKIIVTSNLTRYGVTGDIIVDYATLSNHDGEYCDDSTLMLLNFLKSCGVKEIAIAGFDGFNNNVKSFYITELDKEKIHIEVSSLVSKLLESSYGMMDINYLTESYYNKN